MNIKTISTIINKGIGLALIGSISSFLVPPALSQQAGCSNYWVNPNTGKTECFGSSSGGSFGVIPENQNTTTQYDPFQTVKQSLDESCFSVWLENSRNLDYGSRKYKRLERSYEDCKVAQDELKEKERNARNARWEQERNERNARWDALREKTNPDGFCVSPETDSSITQLSYSTCRILTLSIGRERTEKVFATSTSASKDKVNNLKRLCEEGAIKTSLKSPSTAIFSNSSTTKLTKGVYKVSGNVDAQNGYGAMLRNRYTCIFSHSNDRFSLLYDDVD